MTPKEKPPDKPVEHDALLTFRLSTETKGQLQKRAEEAHVDLSEYMRGLVSSEANEQLISCAPALVRMGDSLTRLETHWGHVAAILETMQNDWLLLEEQGEAETVLEAVCNHMDVQLDVMESLSKASFQTLKETMKVLRKVRIAE